MILNYLKQGFVNTFAYALASLITRLLSFCFLPYFSSRLSLAEFGILDFYQNLFQLGTMLFTSCASISLMRFYFKYKDDVENQRKAIGNGLLFGLIGSATIFVIVIAAYALQLDIAVRSQYGLVIACNVILFTLFSLIIIFARVQEKLGYYLVYYCSQNILATILTFAGVYHGYGIQSFFYANLLSLLIFVPLFMKMFFEYRSNLNCRLDNF